MWKDSRDEWRHIRAAPRQRRQDRHGLTPWERENEAQETEKYLAELEADIMPIDNLIAFAESEGGAKVFGEEKTKEVAAHAKEIKAAGAKYCDCPACAAVEAILSKKDDMLNS